MGNTGLQSCQASTQDTSPPVVTNTLSRGHCQSPTQHLPSWPSMLTHPPAPDQGCNGQQGSPSSPLPLPGSCSVCNPVLRLVARFLSKAVWLLICIPETLRHSTGNIKTQSNLRPASPPPPLPSSVPPTSPSHWPRALASWLQHGICNNRLSSSPSAAS